MPLYVASIIAKSGCLFISFYNWSPNIYELCILLLSRPVKWDQKESKQTNCSWSARILPRETSIIQTDRSLLQQTIMQVSSTWYLSRPRQEIFVRLSSVNCQYAFDVCRQILQWFYGLPNEQVPEVVPSSKRIDLKRIYGTWLFFFFTQAWPTSVPD